MATRNAPNTFTLEQFRVEFNELATDIGNVTGSSQGDQLNTTATDIVGAINEHESDIASLSQSFSITLAGDSGSNQTISDSNTLDVAGGTGIDTVVGATDTVTVAIDSTVPQLATTNTFTGVNRNALTVDNDGSFDMNANNNFKCTPSGNFALTFTNFADGQSGYILLINSGGHTVSLHANSKADANLATTVTSAGTYLISYVSDGTNSYLTNSAVFA